MDNAFVFEKNMREDEEFRALNSLYQVLALSQEDSWNDWQKYADALSHRERTEKFRLMKEFIDKKKNFNLYQPAVNQAGSLIGNKTAFLLFYYKGLDFCCNVI